MATTTTPNLGLTLAVPGSNEPFDTSVVNTNFEAIDTEVGAQRTATTNLTNRTTTIEDVTLPSAPSPNVGVVPSGTTAERNAFWGTPGSATTRVALANKGARWFNTDTGFEERYYGFSGDSATGGYNAALSAAASGWYPSGGALPTVVAEMAADQALTGSFAKLIWGAEIHKNLAGLHSNTTNNTRFTATTYAGLWRLRGHARVNATTGNNLLAMYKNGTIDSANLDGAVGVAVIGAYVRFDQVFALAAGDYIELGMASGASGSVIASPPYTQATWEFLGPRQAHI